MSKSNTKSLILIDISSFFEWLADHLVDNNIYEDGSFTNIMTLHLQNSNCFKFGLLYFNFLFKFMFSPAPHVNQYLFNFVTKRRCRCCHNSHGLLLTQLCFTIRWHFFSLAQPISYLKSIWFSTQTNRLQSSFYAQPIQQCASLYTLGTSPLIA